MRILFIVNCGRRAKGPPQELLDQMGRLMAERGIDYELTPCQSIEDSERALATLETGKYDALWIGGGDGSINKILNTTFDRKIPYGIVPMGTMNALARSLGIPSDNPLEAVRYLIEAKPTPIDVVRVNEYYFLCYASVGYHAALMHGISRWTKHHFGKLAFWTSGIRAATHMKRIPQFSIQYQEVSEPQNGQEATATLGRWLPKGNAKLDTAYSMIISNICNYAGFGLVLEQPCSSRFLELHLFRRNGWVPMIKWFVHMTREKGKWPSHEHGVSHHKVASCTLKSNHRMMLQIDGEPVKTQNRYELTFECLPGAATLLLK